ncbi:MAG: hypothetical protein HQM08_18320 [Candidatus Riflebacteria bacterium]|nr:hypothetical protein [Candidatus Riflebacteria bacterium]
MEIKNRTIQNDERKEWLPPAVKDWEIEELTQSSSGNGNDGLSNYS